MGGIVGASTVSTGNGLSGNGLPASPIIAAAPAAASVGSYAAGGVNAAGSTANFGSTVSNISTINGSGGAGLATRGGTWLCLGVSGAAIGFGCNQISPQLFVRVA